MTRTRILLAVGIVVAGLGVALVLQPSWFGGAQYGWTAYSPLSADAYTVAWSSWAPRLGLLLAVLGAGTAGASAALALSGRRPR